MKRITILVLLFNTCMGVVLAQSPYVIYYAVDELYLFTTQVPEHTITNVNLNFYDKNNGLVGNFYPAGLNATVDYLHSTDYEVKSNYFYSNYGQTKTETQASNRNNDRTYQRALVATLASTYTNSTAIHRGATVPIATFSNDMPLVVNFTKMFDQPGPNGGSQLNYGLKGTFAVVAEANTYPKLISPTNTQLPFVNTQYATISVPDFYRFFPENQIGWYQDGTEINGAYGYTLSFNKEFKMPHESCGRHSYQPFLKDPKFRYWIAESIQIELSPNLSLGKDLLILQPLCTKYQNDGDDLKSVARFELGPSVILNTYKVKYTDNKNVSTGFTLTSEPASKFLVPEQGPYSLIIETDFKNGYFSCEQYLNNIEIIPPKPISITDTVFKDILCFGDKPHLDLNLDGNTTSYTLAYGDSVKPLTKGQNLDIPLMKGSRDYTFAITDNNGCVFEQPLNFKAHEPSKLEATFSITNALCHDDNAIVRINAKGGTAYFKESAYKYTYTPTMAELENASACIKAGTKLSMSLHDSHGCMVNFADTTLYNPADFKLSVLQKQENICPKGNNASIQISGTSTDKTYMYSYSKDGKAYGNEPLFTGLNSGTLTIHTKNQFGCLRDTTVVFKEPPYITISKTALDSVRCFGEKNGSITLNITGGTGFKKLWKDQGTAYLPKNKAYTFSYAYNTLTDQRYRFYAEDSLGCLDSVSYSIGTRSQIRHTATQANPSCDESRDGQIKVSNSGGVGTYQNEWLLPKSLSNNLVQERLAKGIHILETSDDLGCAKVDTFTLTAPPALQVNLDGYPLLCKGQMLRMDAGPGVKYVWGSSKGYSGHTRTGMVFEGATYWVEVTNEAGCIGRDTFELKQSDTEFRAELWVASTVAQGDTVVMVANNAHIDSLVWNLGQGRGLPTLADFRSQHVVFSHMGAQEIGLTGYYKGCRDIVKRKIMVVTPAEMIKNDRALGIKLSIFRECGLFPNPNDGSFVVHFELTEPDVPIAMVLSSTTTGSILKQLPLKVYPDGKVLFSEDLPEGPYVIHAKARDEVVALRFLVAYD